MSTCHIQRPQISLLPVLDEPLEELLEFSKNSKTWVIKRMNHCTTAASFPSQTMPVQYGGTKSTRGVGKFYLGTHIFMPTAALYLELDWLDIKHSRWLEIIRLKKRVIKMDDDRLPKQVWNWSLKERKSTWCQDVKLVLNYAGMLNKDHMYCETDLETLKCRLMERARNSWHLEAFVKPKLCTFVKVHNFEERKVLLKANLEWHNRSLVAKIKSGILPLRLETGRYKGMNREDRTCQVCDKPEVEDEIHFLFVCKPLKPIRKPYTKTFRKENPSIHNVI